MRKISDRKHTHDCICTFIFHQRREQTKNLKCIMKEYEDLKLKEEERESETERKRKKIRNIRSSKNMKWWIFNLVSTLADPFLLVWMWMSSLSLVLECLENSLEVWDSLNALDNLAVIRSPCVKAGEVYVCVGVIIVMLNWSWFWSLREWNISLSSLVHWLTDLLLNRLRCQKIIVMADLWEQ